MSYFKDAKVGDRVYDLVYGEGEIWFVDLVCVNVKFKTTEERYFRSSGIRVNAVVGANQRLFYYDSRPIVITQDDLDIGDDKGSYRLDQYGFHQITKDKDDVFGVYGCSGLNFKNSEFEYTRKVRREEPAKKLHQEDTTECPRCYSVNTSHNTKTIYTCNDCGVQFIYEEPTNTITISGIRVPFGTEKIKCYVNGNEFTARCNFKGDIVNEEIDTDAIYSAKPRSKGTLQRYIDSDDYFVVCYSKFGINFYKVINKETEIAIHIYINPLLGILEKQRGEQEYRGEELPKYIKPALGLRPNFIAKERCILNRKQEIMSAINRYVEANKHIPAKSLIDLYELRR